MLPPKYQWIAIEFEPEGNPWELLQIATLLENEGNREGAATVLDRAFAIEPSDAKIIEARRRVLDSLAVTEEGVVFRYVPAGTFLMGSLDGDPDELPRHPVYLDAFWIAECPTEIDAYRRWAARASHQMDSFESRLRERLRYGYSDRARGQEETTAEPRPAVAVRWEEAVAIANALSTTTVRYALPTEAQWEKAARGGRIQARYPWGDEPPYERADCQRFGQFAIQPVRAFPPNDYGLYAMSGGLWEWTADWYQSDYYVGSPDANPAGPEQGRERVLRGGSWADCAEAVRVSYRISLPVDGDGARFRTNSPNIGFRLCRLAVPKGQ
jgi:formylglycine-generating enzyme required for sulfatase activity